MTPCGDLVHSFVKLLSRLEPHNQSTDSVVRAIETFHLVACGYPKVFFHNVRTHFLCYIDMVKSASTFGMKNHFRPMTVERSWGYIVYWVAYGSTYAGRNHVYSCSISPHLSQTISTATGRNLHNIGLAVNTDSSLNIIDGCIHVEEFKQPLKF